MEVMSNKRLFKVPKHTWRCEVQMAPDREVLRLLRQMAMTTTYHDLTRLEQRWLNLAAFEWVIPLHAAQRSWAYFLLGKYAMEVAI